MRLLKPLAAVGLALPCPTLFAHAGHHHGGLMAELWHSLSAPDHAVPLILGIGVIALVFRYFNRKARVRREQRQMPSIQP